jgi:hypothetical protein
MVASQSVGGVCPIGMARKPIGRGQFPLPLSLNCVAVWWSYSLSWDLSGSNVRGTESWECPEIGYRRCGSTKTRELVWLAGMSVRAWPRQISLLGRCATSCSRGTRNSPSSRGSVTNHQGGNQNHFGILAFGPPTVCIAELIGERGVPIVSPWKDEWGSGCLGSLIRTRESFERLLKNG